MAWITSACNVAAFPVYSVSLDHCTNSWSCISCYMSAEKENEKCTYVTQEFQVISFWAWLLRWKLLLYCLLRFTNVKFTKPFFSAILQDTQINRSQYTLTAVRDQLIESVASWNSIVRKGGTNRSYGTVFVMRSYFNNFSITLNLPKRSFLRAYQLLVVKLWCTA